MAWCIECRLVGRVHSSTEREKNLKITKMDRELLHNKSSFFRYNPEHFYKQEKTKTCKEKIIEKFLFLRSKFLSYSEL
ncbi:MAG: hypothetical protein CMF70_00775 [Magnetovibrio sp.]|nr:hypothetical protein [Magnetovibrio sp.]